MAVWIFVVAGVFFMGYCCGVWSEQWTRDLVEQRRQVATWRRRQRLEQLIVPLPKNWGEG